MLRALQVGLVLLIERFSKLFSLAVQRFGVTTSGAREIRAFDKDLRLFRLKWVHGHSPKELRSGLRGLHDRSRTRSADNESAEAKFVDFSLSSWGLLPA